MSKYSTRSVYNEITDPSTGEIKSCTDRVEVVKNEVEPFFLTYKKRRKEEEESPAKNKTVKELDLFR